MKNCFNYKANLYVKFISLIMKCQQLQMKLLNSKNSNANGVLFTK